jgi:hypothetical protein
MRQRQIIFGTLLLTLVGGGVVLVGRLREPDAKAPEPAGSQAVAAERAGAAPGRRSLPRFQQVAEPVTGRAAPPQLEDAGERIEPGKGMTAEQLADPARYLEDAASRPELLRREELTEARRFYVRYHRQLQGDLAGMSARGLSSEASARAKLWQLIERYESAINRADQLLKRAE